uniref:E1A binding protein p400 n=1 Tax=Pygocentrus nattereri TaxID=42514 RepID=A0AAR2JMG4_PYGNA
MHHGGGPPNVQRNVQRSKSFTGSEQQPVPATHPQSPVTSFAPAASPSAPQSPNYQIIMSRSPVTGQNMNITLQNVGTMVPGNQQITLTPLPLQNPASPSFQHQAPQWRFEHGSSSYIQVTSPLPQPVQPQSPTQHSPVSLQAVSRPGAPGTALGVCGQSPTRFVEAGIMVRQINLSSPPGSGHFVYQENPSLTQLAPTTVGAVQLASPGTPAAVRERRLSQPHSQTGGTIHHLAPQSPVATGPALPTLGSPGHITTSNLPPQISSIIQGQLRPMIFDKTPQGVVAGVATSATASFGVPSAVPPSSPSRNNSSQALPNPPLTPTGVCSVKKLQPKKLEEIAPPNPEVARLRKQCLEHHEKKMEGLKEVFRDYLIELFFLQHLQGNMMDYLAFKKKPCVPLFTYLRQNDLDIEDEEEEEEQSEVINDEALAQADQAKRSRIEVGRHGMIFQHPVVAPLGSPGVPLQQLMPTAQGGMPPTPQSVQIGGQKQNQQQYDPSKGPPVQNAASLHTPPPQLPGRLPQPGLSMAGLPLTLSQGPPMVLEQQAQVATGQLQAQVKLQGAGAVLAAVNPHTQLQAQLHFVIKSYFSLSPQTVTLVRPGVEVSQPAQRLMSTSLSTSVMSLSPLASPSSLPSPHPSGPVRTPSAGPSLSAATQSKLAGTNGSTGLKLSGLSQGSASQNMQESSQDKQAEQAKLESQVHQRIAELRKEGQWSASRLPKLQEASRPKSHWDYLLEEMQWMAADFAQERRWKMAAAKKLVRTCARYHDEVRKTMEREKNEEELRLRNIASAIAREVDYFWSNIQQVKQVNNLCMLGFVVEDEESTIEEQEAMEVAADQKAELAELTKEAEVPLEALVKKYAGAYAEGFEWPQPACQSEDEEKDEVEGTFLLFLFLHINRKISNHARKERCARLPVPSLLHGSLRDYQVVGVEWLANLHRKHLNGILADETGLGKTVQTVAYLAHLACHEGIWGPHLVVVRTCKLLNWEMEFKRWCPGLKILLYLGSKRERRYKRKWWSEPNSFHVCITAYKVLLKDQTHFLKRRWKHLVLDEVQLIKNMTEKHWETIFNIKSQQRILLISNPLQNTLRELWTMIHFLLPGITRMYHDFPVKPGTDQNQDYCHKLVIRLHRMIQPFILRRSKRDVEKQLPKKYEHILKCRLSARQKSMYEDILTQPSSQEALKTGHFVSVLQVLMQLQRICNHPDLIQTRDTGSSYSCQPLQYNTPSLLLTALQQDQWKVCVSVWVCVGVNHKTVMDLDMMPQEQNVLCFIHCFRLFQPVQYGTKPEGRLLPLPSSTQAQRSTAATTTAPITTTAPAAVAQSIQPRGKSPLTTTSSAPSGDVVKVAQLASITGAQNRIAQPETPVTLQFQGNKFTLSPSQLRQLTTGQPLQLQGNILQIVSAPGQPILRQQGSMVMQAVPQAVPVQNSTGAQGVVPPVTSTPPQGEYLLLCSVFLFSFRVSPQESNEERSRQLKERLAHLLSVNERRVGRSVLYGMDLLEACSVTEGHSAASLFAPKHSRWLWAGRDACLKLCKIGTYIYVYVIFSFNLTISFTCRLSCVLPAAVAPTPQLYAANPPPSYSLRQKSFVRQLRPLLHLPVSVNSVLLVFVSVGKLEALSILLHKMKEENRRVLIFTQMASMLDILEAFLDHRHLTYVRLDESLSFEERQVKRFNRNKRFFCSILTNRCCSAVGHVFDADTIVFYDTDLNPSMDARTQEWCDKIGRSKDIHIYRLESGNSIEEKLLKNGTKDLIREVAAQGTDYTLAFLTQRTIQDLFEVEAGSGEKVEEFVVLHQDPSPAESIPPHVARPYIQALNTITLQTLHSEDEQEVKRAEEGREETMEKGEERLEDEGEATEEASQLEELTAVMEQVTRNMTEIYVSMSDIFVRYEIYANVSGLHSFVGHNTFVSVMPKMDSTAVGRKKKKGHGEAVIPPRSLFDKASMVKVRREGKDQKKNISRLQAPFAKPLPTLAKPAMEAGQDNPDWLISEDWALLQAVKQLLELPLNLTIVSPAHTPNWDLVSDVVSSCSRIYRSPKQCRSRYENVIIPREEGKTKNSRPLRTCQIYTQDDNATQIQLYNNRFELMKIIASKRSPPIKPLLGMNPFQKNPKHASVLAESGISYDKPLPPIQVASQRAERIAKEKKALAEQQRAQQLAQQQQQATGSTQGQVAATQPQAQPQAAATGPQAAGVPQANQQGAAAVPNTGNKRLASPAIPGAVAAAGTTTAQVVHTQQRAVPAAPAPTEVVTIAPPGIRAVTPVTASPVVSTSLAPGQSQTRSLGAPGTARYMYYSQRKKRTTLTTNIQAKQYFLIASIQLDLLKINKQKLQMTQQQQVAAAVAAAQGQQATVTQPTQQVQAAPAAQPSPQLTTVAAPRAATTVLTAPAVTNLQVARLTRVPAPSALQAQAGQPAQVTLTKPPPVVSVPAVVSSTGVTTLPVTVAGISVAIGQAQKAGAPVVAHSLQVHQLLRQKQQQQAAQVAAAQQKAAQPQQTQAAVQQKVACTFKHETFEYNICRSSILVHNFYVITIYNLMS